MCGLCGGGGVSRGFAVRGVPRRTLLRAAGVGAALGVSPFGASAARARPSGEADLILHNGKVVSRARPKEAARAVAVSGNRILAVGHEGEVMRFSGPGTRKVNLRGRTVVPGLVDSHLHQFRAALDRPNVSLLEARSIADVVATIGDRVGETPAGAWVLARAAWHESLLAEGRMPTRHDLDPVSPDNPVFIPRGGHVATTNSRALAAAGITRDTADPEGGVIVRDENGEPTGVLLEHARDLVEEVLPPPPPAGEQRRLLRKQMAVHNALGITSLTEPGLSAGQIDTYQDLWHAGELTVRAHLLWRVNELADVDAAIEAFPVPRTGDDMLRFDGLKYLSDGGVEGAFLKEPYRIVPGEQPDPDYRGVLLLPPGGKAELEEMYARAARHGLQVQTHVVGDAAFEAIIGLYERVDREVALEPLRWAIMHIFLPTSPGLVSMRRMGVLATVQDHPVLLGHNLVRWWGQQRAARAIPVREILDAGITAGGGSDAPVVAPDPFLSLGWMVTRGTLSGEPLGPEHGISAAEALDLYTHGSAYTQFAEDALGTIEPGKLADLVVLDADPLSVQPDAIRDISADMTVVDGRVVHDKAG